MLKPTKEQIIIAVQEMMQSRYGFKCEISKPYDDEENENEYCFNSETPTGQSSFSQSKITVYIRFWDDPLAIQIGVNYDHPTGGSNGFTRDYVIIPEIRYQTVQVKYIVEREIFQASLALQYQIQKEAEK